MGVVRQGWLRVRFFFVLTAFVAVAVAVVCPVSPSPILLFGFPCSYVVVFHYLANIPVGTPMADGVLARFWMQPDAAMATLFGTGCAALLQACHYFGRELGTNFQRAVHVLMCALLLSVPALEFVQELPLQDRSDDAGGTMSRYGCVFFFR